MSNTDLIFANRQLQTLVSKHEQTINELRTQLFVCESRLDNQTVLESELNRLKQSQEQIEIRHQQNIKDLTKYKNIVKYLKGCCTYAFKDL